MNRRLPDEERSPRLGFAEGELLDLAMTGLEVVDGVVGLPGGGRSSGVGFLAPWGGCANPWRCSEPDLRLGNESVGRFSHNTWAALSSNYIRERDQSALPTVCLKAVGKRGFVKPYLWTVTRIL